jgi:hypothetical protein
MNIDEYRAMKAQMEQDKQNPNPEGVASNAQTEPTTNGSVSETKEEGKQVPTPSEQTDKSNQDKQTQEPSKEVVGEQTKPVTVEIDGKEVSLDELKSGYLRQSDYTKKTQEAKRKEQQAEEALKLIEQLQQNPQIAKQLSSQFELPNLDPVQRQYSELENKYYDLLIEKEITTLQSKYGEFDVQEVLETARDNNINDLDTAYHVVQSRKGGGQKKEETVDIEAIKQQLRDEILNEVKSQQESNVDTSTIIQSGGDSAPVRETTPQLSQQELKVAKMMGMNNEEYAKWRNVKTNPRKRK